MTRAESHPGERMMGRRIAARLHVGESNRAVLRYLRSRLKRHALTREHREARMAYYRAGLEAHRDAQLEYREVMQGLRPGSLRK